MKNSQVWDVFRRELEIPLKLKKEELELFDYPNLSEEDIWECLVFKFRRNKGEIQKHEVVSALLSLSGGEIMQRVTQRAWTEVEGLSKLSFL